MNPMIVLLVPCMMISLFATSNTIDRFDKNSAFAMAVYGAILGYMELVWLQKHCLRYALVLRPVVPSSIGTIQWQCS